MTAATQLPLLYGVGEKDRILAALAENHALYLVALRSFAREHALTHGTVTIDDVRRIIEQRDFPMPKDIGADARVFGPLFASAEFVACDRIVSARRAPRSGKNQALISVYRLRGAQ